MNVLSVCSGIGAPEAAWTPLGWDFVACSEIEPFPSAVLDHRYPDVPNWGDMTKFQEWQDADVDVLVGGTPCQSFSVAGLRKGLADPRGNLALVYLAIADRYRPDWLVWENVPGVLSSNGGRDFGAFLGGLGELGYGFAYRVLDAQYFGLAQRRQRVFVVGYLGDWRRAAAVLFERESLQGHPAPCRESGKRIADTITVGANQYSGFIGEPVATTLTSKWRSDGESETLIAFNARQNPCVSGDITPTLGASDRGHGVETKSAVRRLTPLECERLQGFPDGYTDVVYRKKPAADGPRYKALGNSMAVPVVRWIGERIEMVDALSASQGAGS
jgi:DNA (cytosine-5)-methyltransferase 1